MRQRVDLASRQAFREDYPMARTFLVHPGTMRAHRGGVEIVALTYTLKHLDEFLARSFVAKEGCTTGLASRDLNRFCVPADFEENESVARVRPTAAAILSHARH